MNTLEAIAFDPGAYAKVQDTTTGGEDTIPTLSTGENPKYVVVYGTGTGVCRIGFGSTGVSPSHMYVSRYLNPVVVNVSGCTHFSWQSITGNFLLITPLSNGGGVALTAPSEV